MPDAGRVSGIESFDDLFARAFGYIEEFAAIEDLGDFDALHDCELAALDHAARVTR